MEQEEKGRFMPSGVGPDVEPCLFHIEHGGEKEEKKQCNPALIYFWLRS